MRGIVVLCIVALAVMSGAYARREPDARCPALDWCTTLADTPPVWAAEDPVEVLIVHAPVFEAKLGPWMKYFKLYHSGLVLRNTRTAEAFAWEFDSVSGVQVAAFPIVSNATGAEEMVLCNVGAVCGMRGYDQKYWSEYEQRVAVTTGAVANEFNTVDIQQYNQTHEAYELWDILVGEWNTTKSPAGDQGYAITSQTCQNAPRDWATTLHSKYGLDILEEQTMVDFIPLYAEAAPVLVDMADAATAARVTRFFTIFHGSLLRQLAVLLKHWLDPTMYITSGGRFYTFTRLRPFVNWHYAATTLLV